ncbi:ly6/PLAUR domain-containing protein 6-like [Saccoglossus kowalevskii]
MTIIMLMLVVLSALLAPIVDSINLTCFICIDNIDNGDCQLQFKDDPKNKRTCDSVLIISFPNPKCYVNRKENAEGEVIEFTRGCTDESFCSGTCQTDSSGTRDCMQCCEGDLCNTGNHANALQSSHIMHFITLIVGFYYSWSLVKICIPWLDMYLQ